MASSMHASATLTGRLADRLADESARRGVSPAQLLGEAVEAYLEDEATDERAVAVGRHLPPEVLAEPYTDEDAEAVREALARPPAPTPALRKLLRGL
jgi:predicted DNA-binding protein